MTDQDQICLDFTADVVNRARKAGADAADAVFVDSTSLSVTQRLGEREHLERSENRDLGLRVLVGSKQAMVSTSDTVPDALDDLVGRALAMARTVPDDPYCGLAEPGLLATDIPDVDSCDPLEPSTEDLAERARAAEEAALAVEGVTNSEGASATRGHTVFAMAASNGFGQVRRNSRQSISAAVLAGKGMAMETDYDYDYAVYAEDMRAAAEVGRSAGEKAVRRLNPQKVQSAQVPLVYDPRVSRSLVGHLSAAANGTAIARGTSFLKHSMGERLFSDAITIVDDPHRRRGLNSRPFDSEGVRTMRRNIIEGGRLATWLLDLRSARQLGLETTGHAARGTSSPPFPSASNLYMELGTLTPKELMADIKSGLYITDMMGYGVNMVTGDYSRGASGFWIEDGELAYPVSEVTVAGNLKDMFANLTPADNLEFRYGTDAPTLRIEGMTVAGR